MPKIDHDILAAAIDGFEDRKKRIDEQIAEIRQLLTGDRAKPAAKREAGRQRRKVSAAGRKRMAEAQRKRWAAKKQASAAPEAQKPKRKMSAAGRKRISDATKQRWALVRAAAAKEAK
jgi:hypothetical protein